MYFGEADEIACWAANVYTQTALEKLISIYYQSTRCATCTYDIKIASFR